MGMSISEADLHYLLKQSPDVIRSFFSSLSSEEKALVLPETPISELKDLAKKLYNFAHNFGYPNYLENPGKKILDSYMRESRIGVGLSATEIIDLKNFVVRLAKNGTLNPIINKESIDYLTKEEIEKSEIIIDLTKPFEFDIDKVLEEISKTSRKPKIKRNIEIYQKINYYGKSLHELLLERKVDENGKLTDEKLYPNLNTVQSFRVVLAQVKGLINERIGNVYKLYRFEQLKKLYPKVLHIGGSGQADFICFDKKDHPIFESCKCLEFSDTQYLPTQEHTAEIKEARKWFKETGYLPKVVAHIYNRYNQKTYSLTIPKVYIEKNVPYNKKRDKIRLEDFDK